MNTALWVIQGLLAGVFLMVGMMKLMTSKEKMSDKMGWVDDFSQGQIRLIGMAELLAAIGLVVPPLVNIAPILTTFAADGLVLLMIGAAVTHTRRKEPQMRMMNIMFMILAAFVAIGRFFIAPF